MCRLTIGRTGLALAIAGLVAPVAGAQSMQDPVGGQVAKMPPVRLHGFGLTRTRAAPDRLWPVGLDMPHSLRPIGTSAIRFRDGRARLYDRGVARLRHAEIGQSSSAITIDALRVRHAVNDSKFNAGLTDVRSSLWTATVGYELRLSSGTARLSAGMGGEKRTSPIAFADGRAIGSATRAIGLGWRDAHGLIVDTGWFGIASRHALTPIERNVAFAAGAPIAERGLQASASLPVGHRTEDARLRVGLHLSSATVSRRDLLALGAGDPRDKRMTLSLGAHF
jgi:hypothetical protein